MSEDADLIQRGAEKLREALNDEKVTFDKIRRAQERDRETVRVREYWGDKNDEQRLITRGIKLRIAARDIVLSEGVCDA